MDECPKNIEKTGYPPTTSSDESGDWKCEYNINSDDEAVTKIWGAKEKRRKSSPHHRKNYPLVLPKRQRDKTCPFCLAKFTSLTAHKICCPKRNVEICTYCYLEFTANESLDDHIEKFHADGLPSCHICLCSFESFGQRNSHIRNKHPSVEYKCEVCNKTLSNKRVLQSHKTRMHSEQIEKECSICKKVLETQYRYEQHVKWHSKVKKFQCKHCEKGFMQKHHLVAHERIHTGDKPFLCDACGKSFKQNIQFKMHLADHGRLAVHHKTYVKHLKPLLYSCDQCSSQFSNEAAFKVHIDKHFGQKKSSYSCESCCTLFHTATAYAEHKCSETLAFKCSICEKGFSTLRTLAKHARTHEEKREHFCEDCGSSFKLAIHLQAHQRRKHVRLKKFTCSDCGKQFVENYELKVHRRQHLDVKVFQCAYCPAVFKWKSVMETHQRNHTGERPYSCPICRKTFKYSNYINRHLKTHSKEEIKNEEKKILQKLQQLTRENKMEHQEVQASGKLHQKTTNKMQESIGVATAITTETITKNSVSDEMYLVEDYILVNDSSVMLSQGADVTLEDSILDLLY